MLNETGCDYKHVRCTRCERENKCHFRIESQQIMTYLTIAELVLFGIPARVTP